MTKFESLEPNLMTSSIVTRFAKNSKLWMKYFGLAMRKMMDGKNLKVPFED